MLQLRKSYEFDNVLSRDYKIFDSNFAGTSSIPQLPYIRYKNVESALAPIAFNEIGIFQKSYGLREGLYYIDELKAGLEDDYENCSVNKLGIIRVYAEPAAVDEVFNALDGDLYVTPATPIPELYNKCMEQVKARQDLTIDVKTRIKLMKGKNIVILISDYSDADQASDYFLTIGLVPVLFPNLKEKFNNEELEYFKTLVNRSQVKRISNVRASETFIAMCETQKYKDLMFTVQLQSTITNLVSSRVRRARERVIQLSTEAETILNRYEETLKRYYEANKIADSIETTTESLTEEIKQAINIEGIDGIRAQGNTLIERIKVPVSFFNEDEVECVLKNYAEGTPINKFLNAVFINQEYKLNILSEYYFNFDDDSSFQKPGQVDYGLLDQHNAWFNPHTYFYQCLGAYERDLRKCFVEKDLLMFNNLAIASTKSINFRDGAVMSRWLSHIQNAIDHNVASWNVDLLAIKCFEAPDKTLHSFRELFMSSIVEPRDIMEEA